MITGPDHLVVVVRDLRDAMRKYRNVGFEVVPGGEHIGRGTSNALIPIEDGSYIELITFQRPNPRHRWWTAYTQGGGLVDACLASTDLKADTQMLNEMGVVFEEPLTLHRRRPDGVVIEWLIAVPVPKNGHKFPFLIKDVTAREDRVSPLQGSQTSGLAAVVGLDVVVSKLPTVRGDIGETNTQPTNDSAGEYRTVQLGIPINFIRPSVDGRPMDWLKKRGPSVLSARMQCSDGATTHFLDSGSGPLFISDVSAT